MLEIIAILRGIQPQEVLAIGDSLIEAGISHIEVPLNSPTPIASIELLTQKFSQDAIIGAGTVLTSEQVQRVANAGGQLIVSPNCNPAVIATTKKLGLTSLPGVLTPSECFHALQAGADGLKFFPAMQLGIDGFKAYQAVLPANTRCYAVGGVDIEHLGKWIEAGIAGFGIGSAFYKPQDTAELVKKRVQKCIATLNKV